jgi:hypothetical protein
MIEKTKAQIELDEAIFEFREFHRVNSNRNKNGVREMKMDMNLIEMNRFLQDNFNLCIEERRKEIEFETQQRKILFDGSLGSVYQILRRFAEEELIDADFSTPWADPVETVKRWWSKNKNKFKK